ncbi:MAG TPA: ATP cone domain-containing protein [Kofleriaceae bacterium]|nr:ATP cone domain-containing protein [Kofleriaceae bacterium]
MQCPYCGKDSQVKDSRTSADGIRRRRECTECKRRFTTYEQLGAPAIKVQKRDGRHEAFDPAKIARVLARIGRDRPTFADADQQRVARKVEAELLDQGVKTIRSGEIVERLLRLLKDVDRLAHDRLAADYLDENGQLRTDAPRPKRPSAGQLGLPGMIEEDEEAP